MKKSLLATAAAATVVLMAGAAQAQIAAGHVGATYARSNVEVEALGVSDDADFDNYQIDGAFGFAAGSLGGLVEGDVTVIGGDANDDTTYSVTGHLNGKFGGGLVGGFVGVTANDDDNVWGIGAEGLFGLGAQTSVYGQLGYGYSDDYAGSDDSTNLWAGRVELRYFLQDTVKLQASAGYTKVDIDDADLDGWNLGVEGEYQFAGTPWSVLAGYDYGNTNLEIGGAGFDVEADSHTFRVGGRYTFGGQTLKARNDAGADLGSVRKLFGLTGF